MWKFGRGEMLVKSFKEWILELKTKNIPLDMMLKQPDLYYKCKILDEYFYLLMAMYIQRRSDPLRRVVSESKSNKNLDGNRKDLVIIQFNITKFIQFILLFTLNLTLTNLISFNIYECLFN